MRCAARAAWSAGVRETDVAEWRSAERAARRARLEDRDRPVEKVGQRQKVGVEDGDELGCNVVVHLVHRARLVTLRTRARAGGSRRRARDVAH
eukprot:2094973-Prymnesium_polylepis.1